MYYRSSIFKMDSDKFSILEKNYKFLKVTFDYWNILLVNDFIAFRIYFDSLNLSWWITPSVLRNYIYSFFFTFIPSIFIYIFRNIIF
jgi:hypothetical protein